MYNPNEAAEKLQKFVLSMWQGSELVLDTNKRMVFRVHSKQEAHNLTVNLRREGEFAAYRKGLKSQDWYVQVSI